MPTTSSTTCWALAVLLLAVSNYLESCQGYVVVTPSTHQRFSSVASPAFGMTARPTPASSPWILKAEAGEGEEKADEGTEEEADDNDEEEEEEEEPEDPEVTALKEEIAKLESTLKEKKGQVSYLKDSAEQYSKAGYARKVAEMENMRRTRSSMASSNREASIANVLRDFLPVKDQLDALKSRYADDDFGRQYGALDGNFNTAMKNMGVTEYTASVGEVADRTRVLVVEEKEDNDKPAGTILEPLKMGLELKGNVVRLAECVASTASEAEDEGEDEGEKDSEGGDEE